MLDTTGSGYWQTLLYMHYECVSLFKANAHNDLD